MDFEKYKLKHPVMPEYDLGNTTPNQLTSMRSKFDNELRTYYEKQKLLKKQFKTDIIEEFDLINHPLADRIWQKTWNLNSSEGFKQVYNAFAEIVKHLPQSPDEYDAYLPEEKPYIITTEIVERHNYNPAYGDNRICKCGHTYDRHFDSYEQMDPIGCKYCECMNFVEDKNARTEIGFADEKKIYWTYGKYENS